MKCNIRESLLDCVDDILSVREDMGAQIEDVYLIKRTWDQERAGEGDFKDDEEKVEPTPGIIDVSHDVRVTEGGAIKSGDLILTGISRNRYPKEDTIRTSLSNDEAEQRNIEKFYRIGKHFYRVIHVKKNLLTWDVHVRKVSQDERERN